MQVLAPAFPKPAQLPTRNRPVCPTQDRSNSPVRLIPPATPNPLKPFPLQSPPHLPSKPRLPSPVTTKLLPYPPDQPLINLEKVRLESPGRHGKLSRCASPNHSTNSAGDVIVTGLRKFRPATPSLDKPRLASLLPIDPPSSFPFKPGHLPPVHAPLKFSLLEPFSHFVRNHLRITALPPVQPPVKYGLGQVSSMVGGVSGSVSTVGSTYKSEMSPLRFDSCELPPCVPANVNLKRVNAEIKALSTDLPCDESAAIFVRADSFSLSHFQALITGVEGTPYAHGLYLFDVILPENYPATPPKVTLLTTGSGSVRLNPNLYSTGYLCLSILNTWRGEADESWSPMLSSLYQVFLSIQSLVMTENIASKEPGFESLETTSYDNRVYSTVVKYANMKYAMAKMIKRPPKGFEEVVRRHFAVKKEAILLELQQWVGESYSVQSLYASAPLAKAQNPNIVHLFSQKCAHQCMSEAMKEVVKALATV